MIDEVVKYFLSTQVPRPVNIVEKQVFPINSGPRANKFRYTNKYFLAIQVPGPITIVEKTSISRTHGV